MFLERKVDPLFGTGSRRGVYDESSDRKIRKAVVDNTISLIHNYEALCYYCCFIFLRYFGIRGGEEVAGLLWEQVEFLKYTQGPFKGYNYVSVKIDFDKGATYYLSFILLFYRALIFFRCSSTPIKS